MIKLLKIISHLYHAWFHVQVNDIFLARQQRRSCKFFYFRQIPNICNNKDSYKWADVYLQNPPCGKLFIPSRALVYLNLLETQYNLEINSYLKKHYC